MIIYQLLKHYSFNANNINFISSITTQRYNYYNYVAMVDIRDNIEGLFRVKKNYDDFYENIKSLANKKLISRNFMIKLLNIYWQETIFVSKSNSLSNTYSNQLKSDGLAIYKNQYKKFLSDFSKALSLGRIEVAFNKYKKSDQINNLFNDDIKYIWKKGFNGLITQNFLHLLFEYNQIRIFNNQKLKLLNNLQLKYFPIFTIVNNSSQIIISEPSDELIYNKNFLDKLYQWYFYRFSMNNKNKPVYQGLFFINPNDALEYKQYIKYKHKSINKQPNLSILPCNLSFYYQVFYKLSLKIQFYLIPDLKELGKLINIYQHKNNVSFHRKQKYSLSSFQGQPIYVIQPLIVKNKKTKQTESIKYSYYFNKKLDKKINDYIFLNYNVALFAWKKFIKDNMHYNLPSQPPVIVYNLEDFINHNSNKYDNNTYLKNCIFIPSKESFDFLKSNLFLKSQKTTYENFTYNLMTIKTIINRIIWSLTSKQPVNL
uniref:hypothetical protein n=1 Tax=Hypnea pseudomusciformis TaxID=1545697 RepID=UPI0027DA6F7F|nr:hypothetical protein P4C74_pgp136 [Hypnea pseudomusciformis]WCH55097.1 hypothetical protein [Hypnea pseudomusciformis]WCH56690.1 hypothetical protein [Hypnea pseudomusciformis]